MELKGGCKCGKIKYKISSEERERIWGRFCCHCQMCPKKDKVFCNRKEKEEKEKEEKEKEVFWNKKEKEEKEKEVFCNQNGMGVNWVSVPRLRESVSSSSSSLLSFEDVVVVHSSDYAERWRCKHCDEGLIMRYACEPFTDWIRLETLEPLSFQFVVEKFPLPFHIYCELGGEGEEKEEEEKEEEEKEEEEKEEKEDEGEGEEERKREKKGKRGKDGSLMYQFSEPWIQDPCRPFEEKENSFCSLCFLLVDRKFERFCHCEKPIIG